MSALERKFQQAIRERDQLRKNLDQLKLEAASRLSSQEMSNINAEKDEIIKELREEGEKLSKQQLQHSNIIKKLRMKEKEADATIKSQKYIFVLPYYFVTLYFEDKSLGKQLISLSLSFLSENR